MLFLYFGPSALALINMVRWESLTLRHLSRERGLCKRVTLDDWLAVYGYLGLELESRNQPLHGRLRRPVRLITAGALAAASIVLCLIPLPFRLPYSISQYRWDLLPVVKPLIAGTLLAFALLLLFHGRRSWRLAECEAAEYPFAKLKVAKGRGPKK